MKRFLILLLSILLLSMSSCVPNDDQETDILVECF